MNNVSTVVADMRDFLDNEGMNKKQIQDFLDEFERWFEDRKLHGRMLIDIRKPGGSGPCPYLNIKWVKMISKPKGQYQTISGVTGPTGSVISPPNKRDDIALRIGQQIVENSAILFVYGRAIEIFSIPRIASSLAIMADSL